MSINKITPSVSPLAEGQMVIIVARWILVLSGLFLALCDTQSVSMNTIRFEIMVILLLAVSNFYLVAQVLTKRQTLDTVLYGMGIADLAVITLIIIAQQGFASNVYTFYFPAMLAFSVVFPTVELYIFLCGTVGAYGFIGLLTLQTPGDLQTLTIRLMMLTAVAVCGNYFARIERNRYKTALQNQLVTEAGSLSPAAQPGIQTF
jgi:hypothetical protein